MIPGPGAGSNSGRPGAHAGAELIGSEAAPPGWVDMALAVPLLDSGRAREELGWRPRYTSTDAMLELLEGLRERGIPDPAP